MTPYARQPPRAFWSRAVSRVKLHDVDPVANPSFVIDADTQVATAGSCFAQHIARHLRTVGIQPLVTERPHGLVADGAEAFHYDLYSARYGNVYSAKQMLQLLRRAHGSFVPEEQPWRGKGGEYVDPFRPLIPGGFATPREFERDREQHFAAVRRMFAELDVMVFTLGLTEAWRSRADGAVFPSCPGAAGGVWDEALYEFVNFSVAEVTADLTAFIAELRRINPAAKVLLTVSPVPLVATATDGHVLTATIYSKSVLRVAAQQVADAHADVDYFPSYEIITGPQSEGRFFADDKRGVTEEGVATVMRTFSRHYVSGAVRAAPPPESEPEAHDAATREAREALDAVCDEMYNEAPFARPQPEATAPAPGAMNAEPSRAWSGFGWLRRKGG